MKVAFCSSEIFPFAKTVGLADVAGALPFALAGQGLPVKVFMPFYKNIKPQKIFGNYGVTKIGKVEFYFIRNDDYFFRDGLYGTASGDYPDNLERFSFFSKQVFKILREIKFCPDIIHVNDWQASLVSIYLKTIERNDPFFAKTKSVITIHNLAYQGLFDKEKYPAIGIGEEHFNMRCLEYYGKINLLKGGIVFNDFINTVSPTYAKQIQTSDYGCGLEGVLLERREKLCGILNAIDYGVWNPATDKLIFKTYSSRDPENKLVNKKMFQKKLGLAVDKDILMLGMVSRLAEQKGVDILCEVLDYILRKHQVVILGLGDPKYMDILKKKAKKFKKSLSLHLCFDEGIAHNIYASCDAFLMPSRFEPCGLSQMISYRYGTVPIVNNTGGLTDTVIDHAAGGGGFVLSDYSSDALLSAIDRASDVLEDKKEKALLLKKIMKYNFSWDVAAKQYIQMYKRAAQKI
jgi:starch synthase